MPMAAATLIDGGAQPIKRESVMESRNPYLKNLNKIEFAVTNACTGKCKHCSQGAHSADSEPFRFEIAAEAVKKISARYRIQTVMVFGGEPLLCADAVFSIIKAATERKIPKRQIITNGYFSRDPRTVRHVAERLAECGVNDLLLSVDAFHQETIPIDSVKGFAKEALECGIPMRLQPAWLVSPKDGNPYNQQTRAILHSFADLQIPVGEGNVIFPEGNALKYFPEYFANSRPKNPYEEDPRDVRCVSFSPNGDVLNGNLFQRDILEILRDYTP